MAPTERVPVSGLQELLGGAVQPRRAGDTAVHLEHQGRVVSSEGGGSRSHGRVPARGRWRSSLRGRRRSRRRSAASGRPGCRGGGTGSPVEHRLDQASSEARRRSAMMCACPRSRQHAEALGADPVRQAAEDHRARGQRLGAGNAGARFSTAIVTPSLSARSDRAASERPRTAGRPRSRGVRRHRRDRRRAWRRSAPRRRAGPRRRGLRLGLRLGDRAAHERPASILRSRVLPRSAAAVGRARSARRKGPRPAARAPEPGQIPPPRRLQQRRRRPPVAGNVRASRFGGPIATHPIRVWTPLPLGP